MALAGEEGRGWLVEAASTEEAIGAEARELVSRVWA